MASKKKTSLPRNTARAARPVAAPTRQHPAAATSDRGANRRPVLIVAAVAVLGAAALIAGGALLRGNGQTTTAAASDVPVEQRTKGNASAPVALVEYADLQCPACALFSRQVEPALQEYVKNGVLKIEFRHFAFLGEESKRAARASECAAEQNQFFRYRDSVYASQRGENRGAFSDARLKQIAVELGLDTPAFNACYDSGRHADTVKEQTDEGRRDGVRSTPTFFINGEKVEGVYPLDVYKRAIEQAAVRAGAAVPAAGGSVNTGARP
jgi:protein-disulfide isomerase